MSTYYYVESGFYNPSVHEHIPEGAVAISAQRYEELMAGQAEGLDIVTGEDGAPALAAPSLSLEEIKRLRIRALHQGFDAALNAGFASDALGTPHRYDSEPHNRENLIGAVATGAEQMFTCDDNQGNPDSKQQRLHSPEQLKAVLMDGAAVKQTLIARFRARRARVWAATDETQVNAVAWDDE